MAASPENYVTLLQLRERWHKRQQEAEKSAPIDARPWTERCEGNDRKRSTDGRKPESLSGKGREKEAHRARDIADRRRFYYWGQNNDGGGEGGGRRRMAVPFTEGSAREQLCAGSSESKVGCCAATPKDGWKFPREKEIVESSCFASAVVEDSKGKEVKRVDCRPKSSDQRQRSFKRSDSGKARAKEDDAGGYWPRPFGRNDAGGKDDGGSPRELVAFAEESGALERPGTRRSGPEVRLEAQKSTISPMDSGGIIWKAMVEDSDGKEAKSGVFHKKIGKSKGKRHGKNKKDAGVVRLEEGQGGVNFQRRRFQRNEDADIGDGISRRDVVASVAEIVALGRRLPRRSTSMPDVLESPPPEKELVRSVCFTGTVVEESSAKEEKRSNNETKKPVVVRAKDDEDRLDNMAEDVHDAPTESMKEECRGNEMNSVDDLKRSNNYQQKGFKKTKSGVAQVRKEDDRVDMLADGHNMPLEAVTLPGRKEAERVASKGKALEVNGSGNGRRAISSPRNNRFSSRERIVVGEDNETQKNFAGDKEVVNKEVEPANKNCRTEGKLGEKQKNGISSKEMVFRSDEGEVTRRLRDFSIGSSRRRKGRERRFPPWAENSRSWSIGNSGRKNGVLASYMDRDVVWVKKGDVFGGNNKDDINQAH